MRKKIFPALALSLMTIGIGSTVAVPVAGAVTHHAAFHAGEDSGDSGSTPPATTGASSGGGGSSSSGGGSSATPSGGVQTGAGGMAEAGSTNTAPFIALGGAGAVLLGASAGATALARRRRSAQV